MEVTYGNGGREENFQHGMTAEGTHSARASESCTDAPCEGGAKRGRILVVDDERGIRDTFVMLFRSMGFHVKAAPSGYEGLHLFVQSPYDMVFTDLQMPGMDGWTLIRHIKSISPKTPVILVTGEEESVIRDRLENSGVDLVLYKPFDLQEMQDAVYAFEDAMCKEKTRFGRA